MPPDTNKWEQADKAYLAHHSKCADCIAAGAMRQERCPEGLALWIAYQNAGLPPALTPRGPNLQIKGKTR